MIAALAPPIGDWIAIAVWVAFIATIVWLNLTERRRDDIAGPVDEFTELRQHLGDEHRRCRHHDDTARSSS